MPLILSGVVLYVVLRLIVRFTPDDRIKPQYQSAISWTLAILYQLGKGLFYLFVIPFTLFILICNFWINFWCPITRDRVR